MREHRAGDPIPTSTCTGHLRSIWSSRLTGVSAKLLTLLDGRLTGLLSMHSHYVEILR